MIQSTLAIFAATPAGVNSAVSGFQSKATMPSGLLEPMKTRRRLLCGKARAAAVATDTAAAVIRKLRRVRCAMATAILADAPRHTPALDAVCGRRAFTLSQRGTRACRT